MKLSKKDISFLRAQAHTLNPVVIIGNAGLSEGVISEIDSSITHHELIKVRVNAADRESRQHMLEHICSTIGCTLIQTIGHIGIIYRQAEKPHIKLPSAL